MTNAEIIAKIQAEIAYLIETYIGNAQSCVGTTLVDGLEEASGILSDLKKSLPAKVADGKGLEVEAINYIFDNGLNLSPRVATDFARHFYELGRTRTAEIYDELEYNKQRAEESEKQMNQDGLEEEIHEYNKERFDEYFPEQDGDFISEVDFMTCLGRVARHFAKWGAEHLKK